MVWWCCLDDLIRVGFAVLISYVFCIPFGFSCSTNYVFAFFIRLYMNQGVSSVAYFCCDHVLCTDLDVDTIMEEAKGRWLRPNEIHALLYNYKYFTIHVKPVNLPPSKVSVTFSCTLVICYGLYYSSSQPQIHLDVTQVIRLMSHNIIHSAQWNLQLGSSLPISPGKCFYKYG